MKQTDAPLRRKKILILAPFFDGEGRWIDDFCAREDLEFRKAPYPRPPASWHRRGKVTPAAEWLGHFNYVRQALAWQPDCVITSFPQLALVAGMLLPFLGRADTRLVAWNFNLGSLSLGWKGRLAGRFLRRVDRFIVHARSEVAGYAGWLGLDPDKFRFVPLQRGRIEAADPSPIPEPYLVSMGSANRDYRTLLDAVLGTGIKTVIISKPSVLDALPTHPDLVKLSGLTQPQCNGILARARLNVVPIESIQTASGQVTFITAMRLGIPSVATRCTGTVDYLRDGETGLLVPPGDATGLRQAIASLWHDAEARSRIGGAGRDYAEAHLSDEAAGRYLSEILDEVFA